SPRPLTMRLPLPGHSPLAVISQSHLACTTTRIRSLRSGLLPAIARRQRTRSRKNTDRSPAFVLKNNAPTVTQVDQERLNEREVIRLRPKTRHRGGHKSPTR